MTTESNAEPRSQSRRLLWTVVLLMVLAAVALWAASALSWVGQQYETPFTGVKHSGASGAKLRPELVPLALATLAAIAAVLATGGWLRRLMGVLVLLAGALLGWRAIAWYGTNDFGFVTEGGVPPGSKPIGEFTTNPVGPALVSIAALILIAAGLIVVARAHKMPAMGAKYSAPGTAKRESQDPDKRLWDALDSGEDPTERGEGSGERSDGSR